MIKVVIYWEGVPMKKLSSWLWGSVLVVLGVVLGINALGIAKIDIFFPGWWTLFIIVPCAIGVLTDEHKGGELAGLIFGICLLLGCLGVIPFGMLWKLLLPAILVFVGLVVIVRSTSNGAVQEKIRRVEKKRRAEHRGYEMVAEAKIVETDEDGNTTTRTYSSKKGKDKKSDDNDSAKDDDDADDADDEKENDYQEYWSTFSGQDISYAGKEFGGCRVDAVFGGIDLDLRGAKLEKEVVVKASSIFGGVIIYVPEGVKVETASTAIFGGVSDKRAKKTSEKAEKTIYIDATCVFGGVEIR